jgi:hypothetical protein
MAESARRTHTAMKVSHYFRRAAKLIAKNERYRHKPMRPWWDDGCEDEPYYESMLGMCAAVANASERDVERAYDKQDYRFEDRLNEQVRAYLRPLSPHERIRWGEFWFGRDFSPEAQQLRIMILLMAAEMAEADGN